MEGVENILRVGKTDGERQGDEFNQYADMVMECDGLDHIEALLHHELADIVDMARSILLDYFVSGDDEEEERCDKCGRSSAS